MKTIVTLQIETNTADELAAVCDVIQQLSDNGAPTKPAAKPTAKPARKSRSKKKDAAPAAAAAPEPAPAPAPAAAPAQPAPTPAPAADGPTLDEVKEALTACVQAVTLNNAKPIVEKYGAKLSEVDPGDYAALINDLQTATIGA